VATQPAMVLKPGLTRHNAALTGSYLKVTVPPLPGRRDARHDFLKRFEIKKVVGGGRSKVSNLKIRTP